MKLTEVLLRATSPKLGTRILKASDGWSLEWREGAIVARKDGACMMFPDSAIGEACVDTAPEARKK